MVSEEDFKVFPIISLWELDVATAARVPIQSAKKTYAAFPHPPPPPHDDALHENLITIGQLPLEIYFFESVDGRLLVSPLVLQDECFGKNLLLILSRFHS